MCINGNDGWVTIRDRIIASFHEKKGFIAKTLEKEIE
jgi:hypothetical protein